MTIFNKWRFGILKYVSSFVWAEIQESHLQLTLMY